VSNYESESAQLAYITQMVLRGDSSEMKDNQEDLLHQFVSELSEKFGLTSEDARAQIDTWMERRGEAVASAGGELAVAKHSTGASIAISGSHPEYYLEIQGIDSHVELQRALSVVGAVLGAPAGELSLVPPPKAVSVAAATVEEAAAAGAAAAEALPAGEGVELGEMDPDMFALLEEMGFGGEAAPEEAEDLPVPGTEPEPGATSAVTVFMSQLALPDAFFWRSNSRPVSFTLLSSIRLASSGQVLISKSTRWRLSISGLDAQDALLKLNRSAETEMLGKKLKVTGPEIFKSRPVAAFIEEESILVNCTESITVDAYQAPAKSSRITPPKVPMMILTDLLIMN
jgi:hypothetical protein